MRFLRRKWLLSESTHINKKRERPLYNQNPAAILPTFGREHHKSYTGLTRSL
jgi:hypothetical protein